MPESDRTFVHAAPIGTRIRQQVCVCACRPFILPHMHSITLNQARNKKLVRPSKQSVPITRTRIANSERQIYQRLVCRSDYAILMSDTHCLAGRLMPESSRVSGPVGDVVQGHVRRGGDTGIKRFGVFVDKRPNQFAFICAAATKPWRTLLLRTRFLSSLSTAAA